MTIVCSPEISADKYFCVRPPALPFPFLQQETAGALILCDHRISELHTHQDEIIPNHIGNCSFLKATPFTLPSLFGVDSHYH